MEAVKRAGKYNLAFQKADMVVDYILSAFPQYSPYLALVGRVAASELLLPPVFDGATAIVRDDVLKEICSNAASSFVSKTSWGSLQESRSLEILCLAYLKLKHSPKHRLDKTYNHYICYQIGRAIISNDSFMEKLQSQSTKLKAEIADLNRLLVEQFQCTLSQVSVIAIDGFDAGSISIIKNSDSFLACSLCDSNLRLSVSSNTAITSIKIANFIENLSTAEKIERSGGVGAVVQNDVYQLTIDNESIRELKICSYSHIHQIIESSNNIVVGSPYFGKTEVIFGYLSTEKHILDQINPVGYL